PTSSAASDVYKRQVLEGIVSGEYLYEPMREYKISLIDGKIQEPDEGQLRVFPVEIIDDDIYIEV
ncbi:hypothetical protein KQJ29_33535, partial [Enterococcus sp. S181_ASV_20]|nr:hypothetical protein [Enterococcus sp. S181_ASV_20]